MNDDSFPDVTAEAAERLAEHWKSLASAAFPVVPPGPPGTTLAALPATAPEQGESLAQLLDDTWRMIVPQLVHWQHPGFLGYYPTSNSPASVLAELVTAGLGVQGMMWSTSPAATELEQRVCDWLALALGLPEHFTHASGHGGGVIQDSASSAVLIALVSALNRVSRGRWRQDGADGRHRVYCTDQANTCVPKAARVCGVGEPTLVPVLRGTHVMDPAALARRLDADRAAGLVPTAVVASVGTTLTCAVDPVREIGRICRERDVWLHVDAAYAGSAALCPEHRGINDGVEFADSYAVNVHKWLRAGTPCDVLWVADRSSLTDALRTGPSSYLVDPVTESGTVVNFKDWQIPLGRPMRALKLWYVLRAHGLQELRSVIRRDIGLAARLARLVVDEPGFELVAHALGLVVFRLGHEDQTRELTVRLAGEPGLLCTPAAVDGHPVLRAAVGSPYADDAGIDRAWATVRSHARGIPGPG
ncbi:MAG TPA: pyridoxal-dependent decarboxylase [Streptomyces sp.]